MFDATRVLIVEDDGLTALDLALSVEDAGGKVIGPVPTAAGALALLESVSVDAAILDSSLFDRDVTPVALQLMSRNVPVVIYSGVGLPAALAERYPDIPFLLKPMPASRVITRLAALRNRHLSAVAHGSELDESSNEVPASQRHPIAFLITPVSVYGGAREGRSAFYEGKLIGIVIPVTTEETSEGYPDGWYLEAGFGPCSATVVPTPPVFADLTDAAQWFSEAIDRADWS